MGIVLYARNFEDIMLGRALVHSERGCHVNSVAQHPIIDSVGRTFYADGWRGIHVEPTISYAELMRKNGPDELFIEAARSRMWKDFCFFLKSPARAYPRRSPSIAEGHRQKRRSAQLKPHVED